MAKSEPNTNESGGESIVCLFCEHENAAQRERCLYCGAPLADGTVEAQAVSVEAVAGSESDDTDQSSR